MPSAKYNIIMEQGADFERSLTLYNPDGTTVDVLGADAKMQVRPTFGSSTLIVEASNDDDRITMGDNGTIFIRIPYTVTESLAPGIYQWDLEVTFHDAEVPETITGRDRVLEGSCEITPQVTV